MADETHSTLDPTTTAVAATDPPGGALRRFWETALGKYVLGGAAVLALLIVAAAVVAVFVMSTRSSTSTSVTLPTPGSSSSSSATSTSASASASTSAEPTAASEGGTPVTNEDVFVFRDPFVPLIKAKPTEAATTTTGTSTEVSTSSETSADTSSLTLQDVVTENSARKAVLLLGGTTYTVGEGEQVADSPWKVLSISGSSVVMLYGDDRVTLTVGQSMQK